MKMIGQKFNFHSGENAIAYTNSSDIAENKFYNLKGTIERVGGKVDALWPTT
jgi:hypothetical protein